MLKIRVLLIDDDHSTLNIMRDYLINVEHFEVDGFKSSQEAMDALRERTQDYDVLLLDWTLKPESGDVLLRKIRSICPDLPAIVMTGNAEAGAEAYVSGAHAYFQKPVDLARLVQSIRGATAQSRTGEARFLELADLNTLLIEQQTLELFGNAILNMANRLVGSVAGCFYLWNWSHRCFENLAHLGCGVSPAQPSLPDDILREFEPDQSDIIIDNPPQRRLERFFASSMNAQASVLLRRGDKFLGLLILGKAEGSFTQENEQSLHALKAMVAPLLEQIKVREQLESIQQKNYTNEAELCKDAVHVVFELLGKPTAMWLIDAGHTKLTVQSSVAIPQVYAENIRVSFDDPSSLLASAIRSGTQAQTTTESPSSSELTHQLEGMRSELAIPLFTLENAPVGAVTLFSDQLNSFKGYDVHLVQYFATQVAKSIDVLRRQAQSQELAKLNEVMVTKGQDENDTFGVFAKTIQTLMGADTVAIYPYDPQRRYYYKSHIHVQNGEVEILGGDKVPDRPRVQGLAYIVRYVGKIVVDDVEGEEDSLGVERLDIIPALPKFTKSFVRKIILEEKYILRENIRAFVGISLRSSAEQEEVGVMYVNYRSPRRFTNSEINLLQIAAGQIASLVQSRRTWVQQRKVADALKEIIGVIGTTDPLSVILEQTAKLFGADHGSISRITDDGLHVQYKVLWEAGKIETQSKRLNSKQPLTEGIVGDVAHRGISIRSGNVKELKRYKRWYPETKSELAVPLKNAFEGNIGVLNLESNEENFFTEGDEKLCENFAHAASAAIQQADLFEAIQSLHPLIETHSLKELFDVVLKNLNKMMGANTASSVNLYDSKNDNFYAFYGVGPSQKFVEEYLLVPPRKTGTGRFVLSTKKALYYEDVNHIPAGSPTIRAESIPYDIRSFAVLPLIYRDELQGALFIHKIGEMTHFSEAAQRILQTYATQAALAIHAAQHHVDIEPLKRILDATISEEREKILNLIVQNAVELMNSDYSSLWLSEPGTGDLVRQAIHVKPGEQVDQSLTRLSSSLPSVNMTVYQTKEPRLLNNVSGVTGYNRIYEKAQSEIAVPLIYKDEVLGTLNTESQRLGAYSQMDVETLRVFADVAAVAIKVAQNRDEINNEVNKRGDELIHLNLRLQRRNSSLVALTKIGQQLTENILNKRQQSLSIIQEQASQIMDTNNMYIALYDPEKDLVHFDLAFLDGKPVDIDSELGWQPRSGGKGRTEWIIHNKKPILTFTKNDAEEWYRQQGAKDYIDQKFASWLGVPILFGAEVMGVIATYHKTAEYQYGPDDLEILELMGKQAAIALKNASLVRQLDKHINELDMIRELGEDLSQNAISV